MNWEELIDVVSELVKDTDIRKQIYTRMIDNHTHYNEDLEENEIMDGSEIVETDLKTLIENEINANMS